MSQKANSSSRTPKEIAEQAELVAVNKRVLSIQAKRQQISILLHDGNSLFFEADLGSKPGLRVSWTTGKIPGESVDIGTV